MAVPRDESEARELIVDAFEAARATGRGDWSTMTTAVLKNRLLQMTGRAFDEQALGFTRFADLLLSLSDLVDVDGTTKPATVRLVAKPQADSRETATAISPSTRIRPDLWNGIIDYSSGVSWVWDPDEQVVRAEADDDELPVLPTLGSEDLSDLRRGFVEQQVGPGTDQDTVELLERWVDEGLRSLALPPSLRHRWNGVLKGAVAARLRAFFEQIQVDLPTDAFQAPAAKAGATRAEDETRRLRRTVLDVVRSMTPAELSALPLPAGAVDRALRRTTRGDG